MKKRVKIILIASGIVILLVAFGVSYVTQKILVKLPKGVTKVDATIAASSEDIFLSNNELYSYVKKFGAKQTIARLDTLSEKFGSCHDAAHKVGRFTYALSKEKSFQLCGSECHSGCYHGATEQYFKEHGTAHLSESLKVLCSGELNSFFSHQCLHGIGHGLMAWTNYDLPEALKSCDLLTAGQDSCWTGVFMENIVGGLSPQDGHMTKYLSEDPQFPCSAVDSKYKSSCYFLQTSRFMQLYKSDFSKVANACLGAPVLYQRSCTESMGRDVDGVYRGNPKGAIDSCSFLPPGDLRIGCLVGAAQDTFWDPAGQVTARLFCSLLTDTIEKSNCYETIFQRAPLVLINTTEKKQFCASVEDAYRERCRQVVI